MRDRVAEVLAERATLDNGAAAGLALSVALHAGITAAVIYLALHHPPPEMANVLTIKFATPEMTAPVVSTPPGKAAAAPPKTTTPVAMPQPVIAPPKPATKNTAPPDAFGRSTKKPAEAVPAPPAAQQPSNPATTPGVANVNDITAGSSGVTGLEGGDFPYTIYIDRMKTLIGTHWFRPQGATAAATVHFIINRDGTIRDVTLETPSGNGTFDRAVQRAVIETSPLPPLPFAYSGTYLGVHLTFR
jgi:TonB family protein